MTLRVYLSNIAPDWPIQDQKELMASRVPGWPHVPTYVDILSPSKRKAHVPASLIQRAELLRQTDEVVILASLACFAWGQGDFLDGVAEACAHGATIVALDTGRRITPGSSPAEIVEAAKEFMRQKQAVRVGRGTPGYLVSALRRSTEKREAAEQIRSRWEQSTKLYPTKPLLAEANICRNTANEYLGKRKEAQQKYRDRMKKAERRQMVEMQEQVV